MKFIDTHCHILPGVDDGPADMETSLDMARIAAGDGIAAIVATPHIVEGLYNGHDREGRLERLQTALEENGIKIRLIPGAEVPMSVCLGGDERMFSRLAIGSSKFLLMETAETTYEQLAGAAHHVRLCGFFPILAHPERVGFVQKRPERLAGMISHGDIFCQLTAAGLEGAFGKNMRKISVTLVRMGLIHLVASDAHSVRKRIPALSSSYEIIHDLMGEAAARTIMLDNPERVLANVLLESISAGGKPGAVRRFFGKR